MDASSRWALSDVTRGRICVALAAVVWSSSGAFTKVLTQDTAFGLNEPPVAPLMVAGLALPIQLAFYRALFAGLALAPLVRPREIRFRWLMVVMAVVFALMNATFVSAIALGTSATAILLQYTAPMWMYLASIFWLGERADWRGTVALILGMVGVAVIVAGGWEGGQLDVIVIALASGVTYAGVLLCLRVLRDLPSGWLTAWNHLCAALVLLPFMVGLPPPTWPQMIVLVLYGAVQMGVAYWLVARGLRTISPQEAGTITLLEPLLNPLWAFLVSPATEAPALVTFVGGAFILGALAWRYWPWARGREDEKDREHVQEK